MTSTEKRVFSEHEKALLRVMLQNDGVQFFRYFFKEREGNRALINWHHFVIAHTLQKTLTLDIKRLIINIPPGYSKTEMAVINYIGQGLAINPRCKYIQASYSADLAQENSTQVKNLIDCDAYQELFPMKLQFDKKGKRLWANLQGGQLLAAAAGGQISGFRAGRMEEGFHGALIVDDPLKPDDAYSEAKRSGVNNRFTNTLKSRLATEDVPIILIMQRVHDDDLAGYLLKGGSGDKWYHLNLPARLDHTSKPQYPQEYTHGIEIDYVDVLDELQSEDYTGYCSAQIKQAVDSIDFKDDRAALWEYKHSASELDLLERGDAYTFSAQYMQSPSVIGGSLFKDGEWMYYDVLPPLFDRITIYGDTAQKTKEHNDYSVFQCWGKRDNKVYLIDQVRGKWEAPELERVLVEFWNKHRPRGIRQGAQCVKIEDKSSGSSLIQSIKREHAIPVEAIQRNIDKVTRAVGVVKYVASGYVFLPKQAEWLFDYKDEFRKFSPRMTHKHDDQIDPTIDAINDMLALPDILDYRNAI